MRGMANSWKRLSPAAQGNWLRGPDNQSDAAPIATIMPIWLSITSGDIYIGDNSVIDGERSVEKFLAVAFSAAIRRSSASRTWSSALSQVFELCARVNDNKITGLLKQIA